MEAYDVLAVAVAVLVGAVAALKLIAPRTQTKLDDRVLAKLEQALEFVPGTLKGMVEKARAEVKAEDKAKKDPALGK